MQKEKATPGNDIVKLQKLHPWRRTRSESALHVMRNLVVEQSIFYSRDIAGLNQKVKELAASQTGVKEINPTVINNIDT